MSVYRQFAQTGLIRQICVRKLFAHKKDIRHTKKSLIHFRIETGFYKRCRFIDLLAITLLILV